MKKAFFSILAIFFCMLAQAQSKTPDILLHVTELNQADTAFNFHPSQMFIRFEGLTPAYDSCILYFETNLLEHDNSPLYSQRECFIRGKVKLPYSMIKAAVQSDGSI